MRKAVARLHEYAQEHDQQVQKRIVALAAQRDAWAWVVALCAEHEGGRRQLLVVLQTMRSTLETPGATVGGVDALSPQQRKAKVAVLDEAIEQLGED